MITLEKTPAIVTPKEDPELEVIVHVRDTTLRHRVPTQGSLLLGRALRCDIAIDHGSVSREHARLERNAGLWLEDLGSSNGTWIYEKDEKDGAETTHGATREIQLKPHQPVPIDTETSFRIGSVLVVFHTRHSLIVANRATVAPAEKPPVPVPPSMRGLPIVRDPEMIALYGIAKRAAQTDITILVTGETGSGKEVLADTIHKSSRRASGPLLALNCAALAPSLLESELFGHEKGAFTGAVAQRAGLFESTNGGTVLLDEIGELPLLTQAKLLRVIEERAVIRVGGSRSRPIDVRLICATNRDLRREVKAGRFREDLYFRISSLSLELPPLRSRPSEIEALGRLFLEQFCLRSRLPIPELTASAVEAMLAYPWPGNVRELKNAMERAPFLSAGGPVLVQHLPRVIASSVPPLNEDFDDEETGIAAQLPTDRRGPMPPIQIPPAVTLPPSLRSPESSTEAMPADATTERERIERALEACSGNQTRAAKMLGIARRTLINRLDSMNLPRPRKGPTG